MHNVEKVHNKWLAKLYGSDWLRWELLRSKLVNFHADFIARSGFEKESLSDKETA